MPSIGIFGDPGSGKGIYMMVKAYQTYMTTDKEIYANFWMNFDRWHRLDLSFLTNLIPGVIIFITEGWVWLESRASGQDIPILWTHVDFQSRKLGVDMYVDAQLESSLDVRFRTLFNQLVFCEVYPPFSNDPNYAPEFFTYRIGTRHGSYPFIWWTWDVKRLIASEIAYLYDYYNSWEIIEEVNNPRRAKAMAKQLSKLQQAQKVDELADLLLPKFPDIKKATHSRVASALADLEVELNEQMDFTIFEPRVYNKLRDKIETTPKKSHKKKMKAEAKALYG